MTKSTILDSLKVCREYVNGDDSHVEVVHVPMPVRIEFNAKTIKALRNEIGTTQAGLANLVGVSTRTVESWESNRTEPNGSAKKLLTLLMQDKTFANKLQLIQIPKTLILNITLNADISVLFSFLQLWSEKVINQLSKVLVVSGSKK